MEIQFLCAVFPVFNKPPIPHPKKLLKIQNLFTKALCFF